MLRNMRTNMNMDKLESLSRLLTWFSPAFPVGGFSYSHGLETAVAEGLIADRHALARWVTALLSHGTARCDAILFCGIWRAVIAGDHATFDRLAELAAAMRGSAELALESMAQGEAFLGTVGAAWPDLALAPWTERLAKPGVPAAHPVAAALATALAAIPLEAALAAYLQAFAAGSVGAAVKLVPLGQTDGQRVMAALEPVIATCVETALACPLDDLGAAAPLSDMLSMRHETQYTRLFRS